LKEKARLEREIATLEQVLREIEEQQGLLRLAQEEGDEVFAEEVLKAVQELEKRALELEFSRLLSKKHDQNGAIVEIHAGAGGTESQDWVEMLLRMYLRWAQKKGYETTIMDTVPGEEAGLKSVVFSVDGEYAFGYLKAENGVHRLVRISPFDANQRRHTSFASVFVLPDIEDTIEIEIKDDEIEVETFRASGAGGQHVNKTDSAVRIRHIPTGMVVTCQNERSQHKNKAFALRILKARLYDLEIRKREEERMKIEQQKKKIDFGSQIRSYVLYPYKLVKDLRTQVETSNTDAVLDGEIDEFIHAYLLHAANTQSVSQQAGA
jgi:peptide chain release factor 2